MTNKIDRRQFLKAAGGTTASMAFMDKPLWSQKPQELRTRIVDVQIANGVTVVAEDGTSGYFKGSGNQDIKTLESHLPMIRKLLVGRDPLDRLLTGEILWEAAYPGKARLYADGKDPLTGKSIINQARDGNQRQTATGRVFMAFSTVDNALWDLRGKLLNQPAYRIMGKANRRQVPVYWRPGEADKGLEEACQRAREAYDRGYIYQKWYFTKAAKDGESGFSSCNLPINTGRFVAPLMQNDALGVGCFFYSVLQITGQGLFV